MVYGIGCDLCSIARMKKSLLGPHGAVSYTHLTLPTKA